MGNMQNKLNEVMAMTKSLRKDYPSETNAFLGFLNKAESGKALGLREKELINVALAVAAQCEWCIAFHVEQAVKGGATRDEIVEAGFMAIIMHGGPAYMYMIVLMESLNEFLPEQD